MSEENIELTAIIREDIRNPLGKLVFLTNFLGSKPNRTKEITLRAFRNISRASTLTLVISAGEIHTVHSLQEIFTWKKEINEIELIAESHSEPEYERVNYLPSNFRIKEAATTTVATLKLPRAKIFNITAGKTENHLLYYLVTFDLSGGASMVSY